MSVVRRMDHFTIVTDKLETTKEFYAGLGLQAGARPDFSVKGLWLYASEGKPILHVMEVKTMPSPRRGVLDHMAFRGEDMAATLAWLRERNIEYRLFRAPDPFLTWQLFFSDPNDVEVEIDFDPTEPQPSDWKGNPPMRPLN
jgi:catechol 2,3-dioxygenase-like lactoylglutathione lyase family enzyme